MREPRLSRPPPGLQWFGATPNPALKCWAILGCPFGTPAILASTSAGMHAGWRLALTDTPVFLAQCLVVLGVRLEITQKFLEVLPAAQSVEVRVLFHVRCVLEAVLDRLTQRGHGFVAVGLGQLLAFDV